MPNFDKEIEKAKQIGADWKKGCERYKALFLSLKKEKLAPLKEKLRMVQAGVAKGEHKSSSQVESEYQGTLAEVIKGIGQIKVAGEQDAKAMATWAYDGPRKSMSYIDKELKLGGVGTEGYTAVATAIKALLTEVSTLQAATENTWKTDVLFQIGMLTTAAEATKTLLAKTRFDVGTVKKQFETEAQAYINFCDQAIAELKLDAASVDFQTAKKEKPNPEKQQKYDISYQVYQKRVATIEGLTQLAQKNYNRVIKSVPDGTLTTWLANAQG